MKKLLTIISIISFHYCNAQVTLMGMSSLGGTNDQGTMFSVTSSGYLDTLYNFNTGGNGCSPMGAFIQATDGNFYGLTSSCGLNSVGTLVRYNPNTKTVQSLVNFDSSLGSGPLGTLIQG